MGAWNVGVSAFACECGRRDRSIEGSDGNRQHGGRCQAVTGDETIAGLAFDVVPVEQRKSLGR